MLKKVLSGALALTMLFTAFVLPGAVSAEEDILHDESSEVVDDSSVAEDESSEVVDDSSVAEDESSEVVDDSSVAEDESSEVVDDSSVVEDESSEVVGDSSVAEDESSEVVDDSSVAEDESSEVVDDSSVVEDESSEVVDDSSVAEDESSEVVDDSSVVEDESSEVVDDSSVVEDESSEVVDDSSVAEDESSEVVDDSSVPEDDSSVPEDDSSVVEPDPHVHDYKETVVEPTYLQDGYTLYECNVCGDSYKDNVVAKLTIEAVSELKVSATSVNAIKLNWNAVENADGYIVYRLNNSTNKFSRIAVIDATTYTNTKLASGTAYTYAVRPYVLADGKQVLNVGGYPRVTGITNLDTVSGFKVEAVSNNAVKLSWTKLTDATGYYFYRFNDKTNKWVRIATINTNTYTDKGLSSATTYKYAVKAYMTVGEKAVASAKYPTVTAMTNLDVATNFKVAATSATAVKLTWDKVSGATGYYFYRFNAKTNKWVKIATVAKNTYTDTKLASGKAYKYAVKPYKTVGGKNVTITKYPTLTAVTNPATVTGFVAPVFKEDSIQLSWNKAAGATGYYVYQRIDGKWKKIATVNTTTYTVTKLARFTDYEFAVKSYRTLGGKTYTAKSYPTLTASTRGRTTLTWGKVSGVTGYQMQISTKSNFGTPNKIFTTSKNSKTVTGLLKNTTYYIRVRSYVTKGGRTVYSGWSSSFKFKT